MNELQMISAGNTDISTWDFYALKAELQDFLSGYEGLIYTDETIKDAKKDRTTLNKMKKVVEDARKTYKARCLEPYEAIEPQIKELTGLIEEKRQQIDETVKVFEKRQKEAKEKEVKEYYDRISGNFGMDAETVYQRIFDSKWTNATTAPAKYRNEIQIAVAAVERDLDSIRALNSPFYDTLKEEYLATMSMESVLQKNDELTKAVGKARLTDSIEKKTEMEVGSSIAVTETVQSEEAGGALLRIYASGARLDQICDFMKAIGVSFEVL